MSEGVHKPWIPLTGEDGTALEGVMLSTLTVPGRNQRELLVKITQNLEIQQGQRV